jgi:hypothetical protein
MTSVTVVGFALLPVVSLGAENEVADLHLPVGRRCDCFCPAGQVDSA